MDLATLGLVAACVTCLAWGVADYVAALLTRRIGEALTLLAIQSTSVPLLAVAWWVIQPPLPTGAVLGWITLASVAFTIGYAAFFYGLRVGTISLVSPISSAGALIPVAAGIWLVGETASGLRLGGIALTLVGLAIMLTDVRAVHSLDANVRRLGIWAGLVTMLAWGSGTALLLPAIGRLGGFAPIAILRVEVWLIIAAWCAVMVRVPSRTSASIAPPGAPLWILVIPAALLDLIAFFSYGYALQTAPAAVAAPVASAYPLVTILIARKRLGERLNAREWSGVAVTLAGVALLGST